jgi:EAL domain-containing protein (putative c-di-GMP-specific phosphodiesterase class I)
VETLQQQELLTQLGCTSLQGFHLGRPVGAEQLAFGWNNVGSDADNNAVASPT